MSIIVDKVENEGVYPRFKAYCRSVWDVSKRHANRLILSSDVVAIVGPIGPIPINEGQTRHSSIMYFPFFKTGTIVPVFGE
jgi:hypothetical protein